MSELSRRDLLRLGARGLAVAGASGLVLRADARPTYPVHDLADHDELPTVQVPDLDPKAKPTHVIQSPYFRDGAPYRAKLGLPMDEGKVMVVRGRVWAYDTKKPLPNARIDVFQVDSQGVYAMQQGDFRNRARITADETGAYELETLHPVGYFLKNQAGKKTRFRRAHIHYEVRVPGYKILATELYFQGDPERQEGMFDDWAHASLVMPVEAAKGRTGEYETVVFDLVLIPGAGYQRPGDAGGI